MSTSQPLMDMNLAKVKHELAFYNNGYMHHLGGHWTSEAAEAAIARIAPVVREFDPGIELFFDGALVDARRSTTVRAGTHAEEGSDD